MVIETPYRRLYPKHDRGRSVRSFSEKEWSMPSELGEGVGDEGCGKQTIMHSTSSMKQHNTSHPSVQAMQQRPAAEEYPQPL
jgi:hypothetical protein